MNKTLELNGAEVRIENGKAIHVTDEDYSVGPADGEQFELDGVQYKLGAHDYEVNADGIIVCVAPIYEIEVE